MFIGIGSAYAAYEQKDPKRGMIMFIFAAAIITAAIYLAPDFATYNLLDNNSSS